MYNVCSVHREVFSTWEDTISTLGGGGGGCSVHRSFQYKSKPFINLLPHMNHGVPRCTHGIPAMHWAPHPPLCTHDIPPYESWYTSDVLNTRRCTKHPPIYWTHIKEGESIQILILKPNANEQVILSTVTLVTGLFQACLFSKRTVVEFNALIDFYPC